MISSLAATVSRKYATLRSKLRQAKAFNATGVISELDELEALGEGRILYGQRSHSCDPLILLLRNGRALLRPTDAAYFSNSGKLVGDGLSSFFRGQSDDYDDLKLHPYYRQTVFSTHFEWLPMPARIDGCAFVLHSPWSYNNYYHFMIDLAPRLMLLEQAGLETTEVTVVAPMPAKSYQREVFDSLGISAMWFNADQPFHIQATELLVVAQRRSMHFVSNVSLRNLRSLIPGQASQYGCCGPEKIFITRGDGAARRFVNECQLAEMLRSVGYVSVRLEEFSLKEQAALFFAAKVVVGQHGAGLTNIAFCRPDATVVELYGDTWHADCFTAISAVTGCRHLLFRCHTLSEYQIEVDLEAFHRYLQRNGLR